MAVEVLALGAALAYASSQVVTKFATRSGSVVAGFVVSLGTGTVVLGALAAWRVPSWQMAPAAVGLFVLAGVAGAGIGRLLMMRAVRDAGASVASPVQSSAQPVVATVAAVTLLGEGVSAGRLLALALVVTGLWVCARGGSANLAAHAASVRVVAWPVAGGAALAAADVLRKTGMQWHPDPVLGAFIGVAAAFVGWLVVLALRAPRVPVAHPPSYGWYALHGLLTAAGAVLLLTALRAGDLSLVAPIVACQPVVVVALGALVLRRFEVLRPGTVVGAVVVFAGVALLPFAGG